MQELGVTQADLAKAADVNVATIRKLQRADQESFWMSKLGGVEDALGWHRGAIRELLEGAPDIPHEAFSDGQPAPRYPDDPDAGETLENLDAERRGQHLRRAFEGATDEEADRLLLEAARLARDVRPRTQR
jgi:transcriptional regulator with XRE-family HTH domain